MKTTRVAYGRALHDAHPHPQGLQLDEGPEVFDAKHSTLHPLFNKA